jgi:bifunctional UDP-N-acetylglucosamine pyrophosphorylase/glucosamine-1-phosphate N-acetyltransferase
MSNGLCALVLAAGQGTRFKSAVNKVLHPILGKPMIRFVLDSLLDLRPERVIVVVGHQKDEVAKAVAHPQVECVVQRRQLGTAHAVLAARAVLARRKHDDVIVINSDLPLFTAGTIKPLLRLHRTSRSALTVLSAEPENPSGFGRLVREGHGRLRVVEEKDASPSEKSIREVNTGVYIFKVRDLLDILPAISNKNLKREFYLTDSIALLQDRNKKVSVYKTARAAEVVGVNTRYELSQAALALRDRKARALSDAGVTVLDPRSTWIDLEVEIGPDTVIYPSVTIEGATRIGSRCVVHPSAHLVNAVIGSDVRVLTSAVIKDSLIGDGVSVGPFCHLRGKTVIRPGARVGNFVEMKKTDFGRRSKAMHLSYLGDSEVGQGVNIGAGTITCNYDGVKKNRTTIGNDVFVGSGTELIAPVRVGKGAYIAAGSTITKDVAADSLAIARTPQVEKRGWAKRKKELDRKRLERKK